MKTKTLSLTLAALTALPGITLAQAIYLSAPDGDPLRAVDVDNSGNVGIGTTSPEHKLDIVGNAQVRGTFPFFALRSPAWNDFAYIQANTTVGARANGDYLGFVTPRGKGFVFFQGQVGAKVVIDPSGNVGIGKDNPAATLDVNGQINCTVLELTSDRNQKQDIKAVDASAILDRVLLLPVSTWAYTNQAKVLHIGPMAQDFQSAFNVGSDDKHIGAGDLGGVALASIQGLNHRLTTQVAEKDSEIAALRQELATLKAQQSLFSTRFDELERLLADSARNSSRAQDLATRERAEQPSANAH